MSKPNADIPIPNRISGKSGYRHCTMAAFLMMFVKFLPHPDILRSLSSKQAGCLAQLPLLAVHPVS